MKIKVDYVAQAKKIAGITSEPLDVKDSIRLKDLLALVSQKHGPELTALLFAKDNSVQPSILISVNDEQVFPAENQKLADGDVVTIMTPMSGG